MRVQIQNNVLYFNQKINAKLIDAYCFKSEYFLIKFIILVNLLNKKLKQANFNSLNNLLNILKFLSAKNKNLP